MSNANHAPKPSQETNELDNLPLDAGSDVRGIRVAVVLVAAVALLVLLALGLYLRATSATNHEALASRPKAVSTVAAQATTFRPTRSYVGTLQPWTAAKVGPQFVSAYVGTVLVRPGAKVRRGEVLATLDCRESSGVAKEIAARARAVAERQSAAEHESARLKELQGGGFASPNELEQMAARARSQSAEVDALKASLATRSLDVDDCILRAPFAGEISERQIDPGAYVRPGSAVVTVIDRSTVRVVADAPESDYAVVAPATPVKITVLATGAILAAAITRRTPAADEQTRTVHFEIDLANPEEKLPVGTTATIAIEVGTEQPATSVPLRAATIRGHQAAIFVIESGLAKRVVTPVIGEAGDQLYLDPRLAAGSAVVLEGRALLEEGDRVTAKVVAP